MSLPFDAKSLDFGRLERSLLSMGSTADIYLVRLSEEMNAVVKSPHKFPGRNKIIKHWEMESQACVVREIEVLRHLGPHPYVVRLIAASEDELLLEYHRKGCLARYLRMESQPSIPFIFAWAIQLGEALMFIHSQNVIHGDFSTTNILITDRMSLVLADFAGSPILGRTGLVSYGSRYTSPKYDPEFPRKEDDFFAFGSVLYEISSWKCLFPDISIQEDWKIKREYELMRFPDTSACILGSVIHRCWYEEFKSAEELLCSIRSAEVDWEQSENNTCPLMKKFT